MVTLFVFTFSSPWRESSLIGRNNVGGELNVERVGNLSSLGVAKMAVVGGLSPLLLLLPPASLLIEIPLLLIAVGVFVDVGEPLVAVEFVHKERFIVW